MLDHRLVDDDLEQVARGLARRHLPATLAGDLARVVQARRQAIAGADALRHEMKQAAAQVGALARAGRDDEVEGARGTLQALKARIQAAEAARDGAQAAFVAMLETLPNLPGAEVPDGADAEANVEVGRWGEPASWDFPPRPHWELAEAAGALDLAAAARLSGARFAVLRGGLAELQRGLAALMLQIASRHGYQEVDVPLLVHPQAMWNAGQYPKFRGDAFATEGHEHVLLPTAEVALVGLWQDTIVDAERLPVRTCAWTPCFRRESGAAGRDTRGLVRLHQFHKVELVSVAHPEQAADEHLAMRGHAEAVLRALELPYRVVELCAGDLGFAAARTFDLEVWLPAEGAYREISSVSTCGDFQARRAQIRWRAAGAAGRPRLAHTLNGSALAVGRALVAVLENGQRPDGSVRLPAALAPWLGGARGLDPGGALA